MTETEVKPLDVTPIPLPQTATQARGIANECQALARLLGNYQNDRLELKARDAMRLVTVLSNAGNVLATLDEFDPSGPAPTGYAKKLGYDPDGNVTCTFTHLVPPKVVAPMVEGYGHPELPR